MRPRVVFAGLFHETHSFIPGPTRLSEFRARGEADLQAAGEDPSCLGGALTVAWERDWDVRCALHLTAAPSGPVEDAVLEHLWSALRAALVRERPDGVWLDLHGAMVCTSYPDVEGELLRRLRGLDGCAHLPVCGVLDLHGHFSDDMARSSSGLLAYRENPHTDGWAVAAESARLLDRLMRTGEEPVTVWERVPLLLPPVATATGEEPMRAVGAAARRLEAEHPELLAVNVLAGFAYADTPQAGMAVSAVTLGDPSRARGWLRELAELALSHREAASPRGLPLEAALDRVEELLAGPRPPGPVVLVEPADNIGGGAPGDLTLVLAGLLRRGVGGAGVALNDPDSVCALEGHSPGSLHRLALGGKSGVPGAAPLACDVELLAVRDGRFTVEDPHSHLAASSPHWDMGRCATVRVGGVTVLLTSRKTPPMDLAQWRSQGLDPERFRVVAVKAAVAHRQAYDPISSASVLLDTPGPCASDLRALPYRHVRRPTVPLDPFPFPEV